MESTMGNIDENGIEKLEQDTRKVNENGEKRQDNMEEAENTNPGVNAAAAVGEVAPVGEHCNSPCPMVVEEDTPVSHSDSHPLETDTNGGGPLKTNTETTYGDNNSQMEKSPHRSPSPTVSLDPDKRLLIPTMESQVEQKKEFSQFSSGLSKLHGDSVKVGKDTPIDEDRTVAVPNNKPVEDNVKGAIQEDREMLMEQDKTSIEPIDNSLRDCDNSTAVSGIETLKGNENGTGEADTVNSADNEKGAVQPHAETSTVLEKVPNTPACEAQPKDGDEPSKLVKRADMPATDTLTNDDKIPDALAARASRVHDERLADMPAGQTSSDHEKGVTKLETEAVDAKDELATGASRVHDEGSADALAAGASRVHDKGSANTPAAQTSTDREKGVTKLETEALDSKDEVPDSKLVPINGEPSADSEKNDNSEAPQRKDGDIESVSMKHDDSEPGTPYVTSSNLKSEEERRGSLNNGVHKTDSTPPTADGTANAQHSFLLDDMSDGNESGTEEEQSAFMKELENFFRERSMEFKPPKFYGEGLNCLKLWRAVTRLGGYDKVTTCKLWRQVGESFRPPKTCTTVSWTFRGFYEKALLEYEKHKVTGGELNIPLASHSEPMIIDSQASGSGRARRDAAARAMQGWHSQRLLGNGEVSDPIIKDKSSVPQKREKQIVTPGLLKRKKTPSAEQAAKIARTQLSKPQLDATVVDLGPPADWVKINVQRTKDCFEVYALVPGLLREEVRVQSDPAGRLVISGEPENPDNLWGATPFKKVVSLPRRIDPHHTSAVVTLNGQLFVRVPLEESD